MKATYSLHHINSATHFGFDADDYSRFKFGDGTVSGYFGTDLADGFIATHLSKQPIKQQIVVISSPYSFIPTATFAMKTILCAGLTAGWPIMAIRLCRKPRFTVP